MASIDKDIQRITYGGSCSESCFQNLCDTICDLLYIFISISHFSRHERTFIFSTSRPNICSLFSNYAKRNSSSRYQEVCSNLGHVEDNLWTMNVSLRRISLLDSSDCRVSTKGHRPGKCVRTCSIICFRLLVIKAFSKSLWGIPGLLLVKHLLNELLAGLKSAFIQLNLARLGLQTFKLFDSITVQGRFPIRIRKVGSFSRVTIPELTFQL